MLIILFIHRKHSVMLYNLNILGIIGLIWENSLFSNIRTVSTFGQFLWKLRWRHCCDNCSMRNTTLSIVLWGFAAIYFHFIYYVFLKTSPHSQPEKWQTQLTLDSIFFPEKWNEFRSTQSQYKSKSFEVKKIKVYLVFFPPHRTANRSPFMGPLKERITQPVAIKLASKYV